MTSADSTRALGRNVVFSDIRDPSIILGGLILTQGVTNKGFYRMVSIVLITESSWFIQTENGNRLTEDSPPLLRGHYLIVCDDEIQVNNEPFLYRTISLGTGTPVQSFRDAVRQRDGWCIVTKITNLNRRYGSWSGFKAAHDNNFDRWITIDTAVGDSINSMQNGMLLLAHVHDLFDMYLFSIDPDDNYKIICLQQDTFGIARSSLDHHFLDDPQRPPDELFRWHFRQAVLANMRGPGEPLFEHDFTPGSDIMGDIINGPKAVERMEV
ncbi:hypothetical protein jhhlp_001611 [Lomentospora prolificans]|uniref:Uncharacterized protein n=1 Tax=Lomentospora prolificans TaxID=41688 RepID=A0A2N3NIS3_9PEZI|nr:hypothetical protein jhhlp_001611 [Lomentospora prolificans]